MLRNLNLSSGGRRICGTPYVGMPASAIPAGGDFPALCLNDVLPGDPAGTLYRTRIKTWPAVGELFVFENTSWIYTPPSTDFVGLVGGTQEVLKNGQVAYETQYQMAIGLTWITADLPVSYDIAASEVITQVVTDLDVSYLVYNMTTADLAATYQVFAFVSRSLAASYSVLSEAAEPIFTASVGRTISVLPSPGEFEGSDFWDWADPKKPTGTKDIENTIDISLDWTPWLAEIGVNAVSYSFEVSPSLQALAQRRTGPVCTLFVASGEPGLVWITCRITTDGDIPRTEDRTVWLYITDL